MIDICVKTGIFQFVSRASTCGCVSEGDPTRHGVVYTAVDTQPRVHAEGEMLSHSQHRGSVYTTRIYTPGTVGRPEGIHRRVVP
jgi:hypothetical protein